MVKIIKLNDVNNKGKIKTNLWIKLDDLKNVRVKDISHAKKVLISRGFNINFTLRNEIFFRGNGIKKTRSISIIERNFRFLENEFKK